MGMGNGMNCVNFWGGVIGLCLAVSGVMSAGGMTESMRKGAASSAEKQGAIQSATAIRQEKSDHAKLLKEMLAKPETVLVLARQITASSTKTSLKTRAAIIKPGSKITIGGNTGLTPSEGTLIADQIGTIGVVAKDGIVKNPYNPLAEHLPLMTPDQIRSFKRFQNADLFATAPESLEQPTPQVLDEQPQ